MINSAILLLLLHYSLLNAQSRSRTHDIKKQTTFTKKKREKHSSLSRKRKHQHKINKISLSLSLSISFSLSVSRFFLSKNFGENFVLKRGSQKTKNFAPTFLILIAFSSRASPETDERELLPGKRTLLARKKEHVLFSFVKIMFAPTARMMMMRSAAPTTKTTHDQNTTHNFHHPKRLTTACKGIRRQRRCRVPLVAMSIPQQGGNAQPRESYYCVVFSLSLFLAYSRVFLVFAREYRDDVFSTPP